MYFYRFNCFPSRLTCLSIYLFPWIFFVSIISTFFARWLCKFLRIFLFSYFARNVHLSHFNPFFPNAPFLYPLKISDYLTVFWCFQEIQKGCIGNECVKYNFWWTRVSKNLGKPGKLEKVGFSGIRKTWKTQIICRAVARLKIQGGKPLNF